MCSSRRALSVAFLGLTAAALASCKTDPIVVTPAEQIIGQVVDPSGSPISAKEIDLYVLDKGSLGTQYDSEVTASDGTFSLDFIRHTNVGPDYLVYLPSVYDFPMVGFAIHQQIMVDLVSTALYEMLTSASNNCAISSFTVDQLDAFLSEAHTFVSSQISRNLIQLNVSIDILHKAYQNAVSADGNLTSMIAAATVLNGTYFNPVVPFPPHNGAPYEDPPKVVGATPKTHTATVNENQTLPLSVSGVDYASPPDYIFYAWSIQPVQGADPINCDNFKDAADGEETPTEIDLGPPVTLPNTAYNLNYTPAFDTAKWNQPSVAYKIIARASDGGGTTKQIWCTTVVHVERSPVFTTVGPTGAHEDNLWTYTPTATSPDGAPLYLKLSNYPGAPALTGAGVMDMCYDSNYAQLEANYPNYHPIWKWQHAGTPCTTPNLITWVPDNCESNTPNSVQIVATDAIGTAGFQTFNVTVAEVNQPPLITSLPPLNPNPQAAEAVLWSYQVKSSDVQADPAAHVGLIAGTDPAPYPDLSHGGIPGGVGCPDTLTYSFVINPASAVISPTGGMISWTPQDNETGLQPFVIQIADGHGGVATQSFNVQTQPEELPPIFVGAPTGNTPISVNVFEELYQALPFTFSISTWDPNFVDNNYNKLFASGTGLPASATQQWGPIGHTDWGMSWPIDDTQVPLGGVTYPVIVTVCDTNQLDEPWGVFLLPAYEVAGPPHNHFCLPQEIDFVAPKRNFQPQITSNPPGTVVGGNPYTYNVVVSDGNVFPADTFTFSVLTTASVPIAAPVNPPAGLTIATVGNTAPTGTATVSWNPNNSTDLGSHIVEISVKDNNAYPGAVHQTTQLFSIFVQEHNVAPTVTSTCPVANATDGALYSYAFTGHTTATTSPNNKLTYSIISGPSGMAINTNTGAMTWTPSVAQAQSPTQSFTLGVTSSGTTPIFPATTQTCVVNMNYVTLPPVFTPMSNVTVAINAPMSVTVIATDPAGNPITMAATGLPTGATYTDNGNGTGTFTWLPVTTGVNTITFTAQNTYPVNQHLSATPLIWKVTVANSPIFQSNPVLSANPAGQYVYEVHVLDPAGKGLTYAIDTGPGGLTVKTTAGVTNVTWAPHANDVGNNSVTLRATDGNNNYNTQSWTINVTTGADSGPSINSTVPTYVSTAVISEGVLTNFVINATEPEGYPIHYDWYLDGTWIYDLNNTYPYLPAGTAAGNHTLLVNVTDGALNGSVTFNVHIRDTIPVAGTTYTVPGGNLIQFGLLPYAQEIVTLQGGAGATYSIFPETGFASGAIGTVNGFAFSPTRMVVENDFPQNNYLLAFFSSNNQINGGGITYAEVPSDTLSLTPCSPAVCFNKVFSSAYAFFGGTRTTYKQTTLTRYNINPSNRSLLSSATNGSPNVDASLGAVTASSVLYDTVVNKVFVSIAASNEILVVDPATRTVSNTINLPLGSYPTAMYLNDATKNLYVYNTGNGTLSEINALTFAVNATSTGLPSAPSVGNDPAGILTGNDADNLLYIAVPDTGAFLTFDINAGNFKSLGGLGASVIGIDTAGGAVVGASYGNGTIIQLK